MTCNTLPLFRSLSALLLAVDAEIIVGHSHGAVSIDGYMHGLVHQVIVARTLADNSEVVYERQIRLAILQGCLKALLRGASRLVLVTSGLAGTAETLWLKMEVTTDVVAIDGGRNQGA
jgi:hypothetical protein